MRFVLFVFFIFILLCQPCFPAEKEIWLYLDEQVGIAYENEQVVHRFEIMSGHELKAPTPVGSFIIRSKIVNGYSRKYGAEMPYAMNFTGSYFLHAWSWSEPLPPREERRWYASHGCVSVNLRDAQWLFNWAPIGTPVIIVGQRYWD